MVWMGISCATTDKGEQFDQAGFDRAVEKYLDDLPTDQWLTNPLHSELR